MMTTMDTNARFPAFGSRPPHTTKAPVRASTKPVNSVWGTGAWGNTTAIGSGSRSQTQEGRSSNEIAGSSMITEGITGSGSLLSSSESEHRPTRSTTWNTTTRDEGSAGLAVGGASPLLRQRSTQSMAHSFGEEDPVDKALFGVTMQAGGISTQSGHHFLDPSSRSFAPGLGEVLGNRQPQRSTSDENDQFNARRKMGAQELGLNMGPPSRAPASNNISGYASSAASRSGSQPPSRNDGDYGMLPRSERHNFRQTPAGSMNYRPNVSAHAPPFVTQTGLPGQINPDQLSPAQLENLTQYLDRLNITSGDYPLDPQARRSPYDATAMSRQISAAERDFDEAWPPEDLALRSRTDQLSPTGSATGSMGSAANPYRRPSLQPQFSNSPSGNESRMSHHSPYYSTGGTPTFQQQYHSRDIYSGLPPSQAAALERKLQGLQEQQQRQRPQRVGYPSHLSNSIPFQGHMPQDDMQTQSAVRANALGAYYNLGAIPPYLPGQIPRGPQNALRSGPYNDYYNFAPPTHHFGGHHSIPRGPARDQDLSHHLRSQLLDDFRLHSKTKRYELKDIYNHIVEFSGDQHGSRFIQTKLETANSDEKEQVFRELHPNARQLMTDVFGNYVIQKFFEHGNQAQKKMLANQMRNHVLALSMQIYGCRVVQKALEHILTDQQAELVKELRNDVMKCVKDQNGNHVIQKAIERVPSEHIDFIIAAFTGRVQEAAVHPYGCRVVQRMLEFCEEPTRTAILAELHACASSVIVDQYGNYVAQHVIEHGQASDRAQMVQLVVLQLVNYSKHKFASNVVEKSIEFGSTEERQAMVQILSLINDKGESPVQGLIRDQYGNYVMQKLITQLRGPEWTDFIEMTKMQISMLKRLSFGNGKQIAAVEKVLYTDAFPQQQQPSLQPASVPVFNNNKPSSITRTVANADAPAVAPPSINTSHTQSPQSSAAPSTHATSVDMADESRKSSGSSVISTSK